MKTEISISIDTNALETYHDQHLVALWAVTQINPAPLDSLQAGEVAEDVAREIVRRFVNRVGLPLWTHQARHAYAVALSGLGKWKNGEFVPSVGPIASEVSP